MTVLLHLPYARPPLLTNQTIGARWQKLHGPKKEVQDTIGWLARKQHLQDLPQSEVVVTWFSGASRLADCSALDWFTKVAIDGLVGYGVWPDDNPKFVAAVTNRVVRAAGKPEIVVAILPAIGSRLGLDMSLMGRTIGSNGEGCL